MKTRGKTSSLSRGQVGALVLACLLVVSLSGCRMPSYSSAEDTSAGTLTTQTTTASSSTRPNTLLTPIKDIGAGDVNQIVTITGQIDRIDRHSGGNAILQVKDDTGSFSVFLEKSSGFDLLRFTVGMTLQATGQVQTYQSLLELVPESDQDLVLTGDDRFETVQVTRVSDGDTIIVRGTDGKDRKIRILGVDTPEMPLDGKPAEYYAIEARTFTENSLMNRTVFLERDNSDTDDYGRQLRYVWLDKPDAIAGETVSSFNFSSILIQGGYATAYRSGDDDKYRSLFLAYEEEARNARTGMWQSP